MQPSITEALAAISNHKPIAQKSDEWLAARKNLIAASESGYLLGIRSTSSMINYIKAKCDLSTSLDNISKLDSIRHGNIYEDVSRAIYESRHGVEVQEYGLITTAKHALLGASPDGIVVKERLDAESSQSRIGRLVEIKNPYDYDPSDLIKPEYIIQVLQQQYVLDLPKCDFIKTNIIGSSVNDNTASQGFKPYYDIDAFLADTHIQLTPGHTHTQIANKNIPHCNLTHLGMEKGVIIHYKNPATGQYVVILYPLDTPYTKSGILDWIKTIKNGIMSSSQSGILASQIAVEYWYLAAYFEKTLEYDANLFQDIYLPRLELVWQLIGHIRHLQTKYTPAEILTFIDGKLQPHLKRPSAFYKCHSNQEEICQILAKGRLLDIHCDPKAKAITNIPTVDTVKNMSKSKSNSNSNSNKKPTTKKTSKIIIEYDF
jgi:hypothetical protein